jgi:hypothetical protein
MIINEMVDIVRKNYVCMLGGKAKSESVGCEKIKNLIETIEGQGINVLTTTLPTFVMEDEEYDVKTYKIDKEHPFELESNVDTVFLYQWYEYENEGPEVIRFATKSKVL